MKKLYPNFEFFVSIFWMLMMFGGAAFMFTATVITDHWFMAMLAIGCAWLGFTTLRTTYRWHSIPPISRLSIGGDGPAFSGKQRPFADARKLFFAIGYTRKSVNFAPAGADATGALRLEWRDGTEWQFRAGPGVMAIFAGSQGAEEVKDMIRKMSAIGQAAGIAPVRITLGHIVR